MTKADLITGFLGAGKTTFIGYYSRYLRKNNISFAVIENELGTAGTDARILSLDGEDVTELSGGCICCGLKVSFHDLLLSMASSGRYDRIIIEPSGVFSLDDYFDVIDSPDIKKVLSPGAVVSVCDPFILENMTPSERMLSFCQLHGASRIFISKLDCDRTGEFDGIIDGIFSDYGTERQSTQRIYALGWDALNDGDYKSITESQPVRVRHDRIISDHSTLYNVASLRVKRTFTSDTLTETVKHIMSGKFGEIIRIKGFVRGENSVLCVNCSARAPSVYAVSTEGTGSGYINIIGRNIDRASIKSLLE